MPRRRGGSAKNRRISAEIRRLMKKGYKQKQAVAIALSKARGRKRGSRRRR